jgi:hypothetical protein
MDNDIGQSYFCPFPDYEPGFKSCSTRGEEVSFVASAPQNLDRQPKRKKAQATFSLLDSESNMSPVKMQNHGKGPYQILEKAGTVTRSRRFPI